MEVVDMEKGFRFQPGKGSWDNRESKGKESLRVTTPGMAMGLSIKLYGLEATIKALKEFVSEEAIIKQLEESK